MSVVVNYASSHTLEALPEVPSSNTLTIVPPAVPSTKSCYEIKYKLRSENSLVLFTQHALTSERIVMKMLQDYKDTRYSLETIDKRQQCLLEALRSNRVFTPEVYIGLARIDEFDLHEKYITIGEILSNPTKEELEPDAEYVLVMYWLPEDRRLDMLLVELDEVSLREHLQLLTRHVAYLHTQLVPSIPAEDGVQWGSYEQLHRKLLENVALLDMVLTKHKNDEESHYIWLEESVNHLQATLLTLLAQGKYNVYFARRVQDQRVKLCHGDLKAPQIWIMPQSYNSSETCGQSIKILDAIDFNPSFSNIDILSDFAMLVVDIQARRQAASIVDDMIAYYLELTGQKDDISAFVLGYYQVEKAIVGTAISILYDDVPELGLSFLKVAETRLQFLVDMQKSYLHSIQCAP